MPSMSSTPYPDIRNHRKRDGPGGPFPFWTSMREPEPMASNPSGPTAEIYYDPYADDLRDDPYAR